MAKNGRIMNLLNISKTRTNFKKQSADLDSTPEFTLRTALGCSGPKPCILVCYFISHASTVHVTFLISESACEELCVCVY